MSRAGFTTKDLRKNLGSITVGASQTDVEIGPAFAIRGDLITAFLVDIESSAFTLGAGITVKLQVRSSNLQAWADSKTASATAVGTTTIKLLDTIAGDQTFLPLKPQARVVVTTGAGSSITVSNIFALETSSF